VALTNRHRLGRRLTLLQPLKARTTTDRIPRSDTSNTIYWRKNNNYELGALWLFVQFSKFELESLSLHNKLRAKHSVPPLQLSKKVCIYSFPFYSFLFLLFWITFIAVSTVTKHMTCFPAMRQCSRVGGQTGCWKHISTQAKCYALSSIRIFHFSLW